MNCFVVYLECYLIFSSTYIVLAKGRQDLIAMRCA